MRWFLLGVIVLLAAALILPRVIPVTAESVHATFPANVPGDYPASKGYSVTREITTTPQRLLEVLDDIAKSTPRTRWLAGSVEERQITYVTRSRIFGFPDYTTVQIVMAEDGQTPLLQISARARYGKSDLGVNKERVNRWLAELGLLTVAP
ncbi:DUF1499 domain-containing protein [Yoonia sediminilitoris]|uniref:Uncharacterized protein DUF1499 n=1 Tax=Yoonia sediminilitoris TaxID=1286148 RepID=A0A2T6KCR2_9RHOB|nr:DUF1499 domain-containing protein [Yoonia sediminilitoris]PUB12749.1 uncharacterized protein DUF1499 [Yoonia sediminilitoris]RCW94228.1 uncharacterized protein DUF1499 [Yoonia sediminilitoris]